MIRRATPAYPHRSRALFKRVTEATGGDWRTGGLETGERRKYSKTGDSYLERVKYSLFLVTQCGQIGSVHGRPHFHGGVALGIFSRHHVNFGRPGLITYARHDLCVSDWFIDEQNVRARACGGGVNVAGESII